MASIRQLLRTPHHPLAALYRGLTPNLVGNATSWASFFLFKSRMERAIASLKGTTASTEQGTPELTPADFFVASGAAGAAVQVLTNPIWVLKTRMLSSDRGAAGAYPSMLAGAVHVFRSEGLAGFYRGLAISLVGVSHGAVQFAVYEPTKRLYFSRRQRRAAESSGPRADDVGHMNAEATVVIATVSKAVAGAVTYPYQVVRSRLQNYDADARFGKGIVGVCRRLWADQGLRGFYRGLVPGVVRVLPATWVTFLVYENVRFYLPRWAG